MSCKLGGGVDQMAKPQGLSLLPLPTRDRGRWLDLHPHICSPRVSPGPASVHVKRAGGVRGGGRGLVLQVQAGTCGLCCSPGLPRSQAQSCTFIFHVSSCGESLACFPREMNFFTFLKKRRWLCLEPQSAGGTSRHKQARRKVYTCQGLLCCRRSRTRRRGSVFSSGAATGLSKGQTPTPPCACLLDASPGACARRGQCVLRSARYGHRAWFPSSSWNRGLIRQ